MRIGQSRVRFDAATVIAIMLLSTGCAHTPKVHLGYYLPRSEIHLKVDRVLACSKNSRVIEVVAVTPTTRFMADRGKWRSIPVADLDGSFADADLKFEFYDDGRLKTVNATTTGKGEDIIKSAISFVGLLGFDQGSGSDPESCAIIKRLSEEAAVLTLTYEGTIEITGDAIVPIAPVVGSAFAQSELASHIGGVCASVGKIMQENAPTIDHEAEGAKLKLVQPGIATVSVKSGGKDGCEQDTHWVSEILAPQFGKEYDLLIPKSALFGKQVFEISVGESGTLTSVKYGKETGANQVLTVLNTAIPQFQNSTTEQTEKANNEIARIRAIEALAKCRADPKTC